MNNLNFLGKYSDTLIKELQLIVPETKEIRPEKESFLQRNLLKL